MHADFARRATVATAAGSITLLAISLLGAWFIHHVNQLNSAAMATHMEKVVAAEELEIEMREVRNRLNRFLRTDDRQYIEAIPKLRSRTEVLLKQAKQTAQSPDEREAVEALETGYEKFFDQFQAYVLQLPAAEARHGLSNLIDDS